MSAGALRTPVNLSTVRSALGLDDLCQWLPDESRWQSRGLELHELWHGGPSFARRPPLGPADRRCSGDRTGASVLWAAFSASVPCDLTRHL